MSALSREEDVRVCSLPAAPVALELDVPKRISAKDGMFKQGDRDGWKFRVGGDPKRAAHRG